MYQVQKQPQLDKQPQIVPSLEIQQPQLDRQQQQYVLQAKQKQQRMQQAQLKSLAQLSSSQPPLHHHHGQSNQQQQQLQRSLPSAAAAVAAEKKKNIFDIYKSSKQKIMISFYNIYRNYPSSPPSFTSSPLWMMGQCYSSPSPVPPLQSRTPQPHISNTDHQQQQQQQQQQLPAWLSTFFQPSNNNQAQHNQQQQQQQQQQHQYKCNNSNNNNNNNNSHQLTTTFTSKDDVDRFVADFKSILWISYRKDFLPFANTTITTDIGWGCMVRTGQMLLARALLKYFYKNERIPDVDKNRQHTNYRRVMTWFYDSPSKESQYSIHQIVNKNKLIIKYHNSKLKDFDIESDDDWKNIEEWFSPTKIAIVLRHLVKSHSAIKRDVTMYVPSDGVVYKDHVRKLCTATASHSNNNSYVDTSSVISSSFITSAGDWSGISGADSEFAMDTGSQHLSSQAIPHPVLASTIASPSSIKSNSSSLSGDESSHIGNHGNPAPFKDPLTCPDEFEPPRWKSIIILIPIKLGVEKLNEVYFQEIKAMLEIPQSIGIIGGKPKQSFYFVGHQDDSLFYLDPHFVHDTVNPNDITFADTYHCCIPQKMSISQLDPSMAIGFFCRTEADFEDFCKRIRDVEKSGFPIVSIGDTSPDYQVESDDVDLNDFEEELEHSFINNLHDQMSEFVGGGSSNVVSGGANNNSNSNSSSNNTTDDEDGIDGFTVVN
ncbi:hypothetical protein SAMD00019534_066890 [Acytostelium subglobosum LB1]|uniref:hypothetical protein n=1 Tax=Acytostelium subglobosum LB1 TaxID=1410327 RepID=UPI0006450F83|nr:hypothetical protein SAMD00019534_066890 [Acytostelium subglobosum LB1]GAM23514.1 hypothetical protein SAMD00019534_066890 [Acytostelium subglobosum LB1]|eukprot:XP_012753255.1 hypothetical protein SAMD00019534_066890 [Acytostelium subglobosum LB1]